jgi:hypothetical protein
MEGKRNDACLFCYFFGPFFIDGAFVKRINIKFRGFKILTHYLFKSINP